jgi:NarL family two-component system response regulator LiaR
VDRHPIVRLGLKTSLENDAGHGEFKVVAETGNADDGLAFAEQFRPDIVLLEIALDGPRKGLDVARALRKLSSDIRIVVLSSHASASHVQSGIDAGVDAYLLKETPPRDILDSIRSVLNARQVFSARLMKEALGAGGKSARLTRKQLDVLQRCAEGYLNEEIATALGISAKAVQVHLSGIYSRLGARTRTEAVILAVKQGLVAIES